MELVGYRLDSTLLYGALGIYLDTGGEEVGQQEGWQAPGYVVGYELKIINKVFSKCAEQTHTQWENT